MLIISLITFVILLIASAFHFYWSFGGRVAKNSAIPEVNGKPVFKPSNILTFLVAITLLGLAILSILLFRNSLELKSWITYFSWLVSILLLLRAVGDFNLVGFFKKVKGSNFSNLDTKYFSPLCLLLSIAFFVLSTTK